MALTLLDARRLAAEVVNRQNPELDVVGVIHGEGATTYTEVILTVRGCHREPCRMVIGVDGDTSERDFRVAFAAQLRAHARDRSAASAPVTDDS